MLQLNFNTRLNDDDAHHMCSAHLGGSQSRRDIGLDSSLGKALFQGKMWTTFSTVQGGE
jgi:hypothetical protein